MASGIPYFPQTLNPNTVIGRLASGPGPTEAIPMAALLAALGTYGASSLFTFLQTGTGAVSRTGQSKLGDIVSAFDYMSVAQIADVVARTNTLDVTAALNYAFAQTGRTIHLPAGSYRILSNLAVPTCAGIIGDGVDLTILLMITGVTKGLQLQGTSVTGPTYVAGFSIEGNATTNAIGIEIGKSTGSGSGILTYNNAVVERVKVYSFTGTGAIGWRCMDMNFTSFYDCVAYNNRINRVCDKTGFAGTTPADVSFFDFHDHSSLGKGSVFYQGSVADFSPWFDGSVANAISVETSNGISPPGYVEYKAYKPHFENIFSGDVTKWCVSVTATTGSAYVMMTDPEVQGSGTTYAKFLAATGADTTVVVDRLNSYTASQSTWINADNGAKITVNNYGGGDITVVPLRALVTLASGAVLTGASMVNNSAAITATCGTSGTITLTNNVLSYVKNGAVVTFSGQITVASVSSPVGTLTLGSLPYACTNTNGAWASVSVYLDASQATAATAMQGYIAANSTGIVLQHFAAGVGANAAADIKAGSTIIVSGSYFTDG